MEALEHPGARMGVPAAEEKPKFARLIIPTRLCAPGVAAEDCHERRQALFVGGPGTAKTTAIKQFAAGFDSDTTATKDITFSSLRSRAPSRLRLSPQLRNDRAGPSGPIRKEDDCLRGRPVHASHERVG